MTSWRTSASIPGASTAASTPRRTTTRRARRRRAASRSAALRTTFTSIRWSGTGPDRHLRRRPEVLHVPQRGCGPGRLAVRQAAVPPDQPRHRRFVGRAEGHRRLPLPAALPRRLREDLLLDCRRVKGSRLHRRAPQQHHESDHDQPDVRQRRETGEGQRDANWKPRRLRRWRQLHRGNLGVEGTPAEAVRIDRDPDGDRERGNRHEGGYPSGQDGDEQLHDRQDDEQGDALPALTQVEVAEASRGEVEDRRHPWVVDARRLDAAIALARRHVGVHEAEDPQDRKLSDESGGERAARLTAADHGRHQGDQADQGEAEDEAGAQIQPEVGMAGARQDERQQPGEACALLRGRHGGLHRGVVQTDQVLHAASASETG